MAFTRKSYSIHRNRKGIFCSSFYFTHPEEERKKVSIIPVELLNVIRTLSPLVILSPYRSVCMVFPFIQFPRYDIEWELMMLCLFRALYPFIFLAIELLRPFTLFNFASRFFYIAIFILSTHFFLFLGTNFFYNFNFFFVSLKFKLNWHRKNPSSHVLFIRINIKTLPYHFTIVYSFIIHLLRSVTLIKLLICFYLFLIRRGFVDFDEREHRPKCGLVRRMFV